MTEYGILAALVATVSIIAIVSTGEDIRNVFGQASAALEDPNSVELPTGDTNDQEVAEVDQPTLRGAGQTVIAAGVTAIDAPLFAGTVNGDLLVAFVAHRSTLTPPEGWVVEHTQKNHGYNQWLSLVTKVKTAEDPDTFRFEQTDSDRLLAQILTVEGERAEIASIDANGGDDDVHAGPSYFVAEDDGLMLAARGEAMGDNSQPFTVTAPEGWTLTTPETADGNRLGIAWAKSPEGSAGTTAPGVELDDPGVASHNWAAMLVQVTTDGTRQIDENYSVYADYIGPDFLFLTPADDTANFTAEPGVFGDAGNDTIDGPSGGRTYIGGKGNDSLTGDDSDDTYVYAFGDGDDWIYDYDYTRGSDLLALVDINSDEVSISRSGDHAVFTIDGGGSITVNKSFDNDGRYSIETILFANGESWDAADQRDRMIADSKSSGTVVGTEETEYYVHAKGDGVYTIEDYDYTSTYDQIFFIDSVLTDLKLRNAGSRNLEVTIPGTSDRITILGTLDSDARNDLDEWAFSDGAKFDMFAIRNKMVEDMKPSGAVVGTERNEDYFVREGDGSYTLTDYDYMRGDDSITFEALALADVTLRNAGGDNMTVTLPSGETITVQGTLDEDYRNDLERWIFTDGTYDMDTLRNKMVRDMVPSGNVVGTERNEDYFVYAGEGSYDLTDYDYMRGDDSITFDGIAFNDVVFTNVGSDHLDVAIPGGDVITIKGTLDEDARNDLERWIFLDGTYDTAQVRNRMVDQMVSTGSVVGTERNEDYFVTAGRGSYTINEYDYRLGDDSITFNGMAAADVDFFNAGGDELRITIPGGETVTLINFLHDAQRYGHERFIFTDGTLNRDEVRNRMVSDMKATGRAIGTELSEYYAHTAAVDGSYSIYDYSYRARANVLDLTDVASTQVTFSTSGSNGILTLSDGDTITLERQLDSTRYGIHELRFSDGVTWDRATIDAQF